MDTDLTLRERRLRRDAAINSIDEYVRVVQTASGANRDRAMEHLMEQTAQRVADGRVTFAEGAQAAGYTREWELKGLQNRVTEIRAANS